MNPNRRATRTIGIVLAFYASAGASSQTLRMPPAAEPHAPQTYRLDCQAQVNSDTSLLHSLAAANEILFEAGDRLLLKRGTKCDGSLHPRGSGDETSPIQIGAYGEGSLPRIEASSAQTAALALFNQQYWDVSSLELSGSATYGVSIGGDAGVLHHLHLRDLLIHDVRGPLKRKESGLLVINAVGKGAGFDDVQIDGVHAWNTTQWAGIFVSGASRVRIRNSVAHDVQGDGIVVFESHDAVIARSVAWHTGMQHQLSIGTPNAIWTWRCTDCLVEENEAFLTDSPGVDGGAFDIDFGNTRNTVRRNFGHDTVGYCVSVFGAFGPTTASVVADNLCIHNATSPRLAQRQGAILLMTWQRGALDGVEVRGNRIDWQPPGDTPAIQTGTGLQAGGVALRENEIWSTGVNFVDPALKYTGEGNRYVLQSADRNDMALARQRLALLHEPDASLSSAPETLQRSALFGVASANKGTWQLIVSASGTALDNSDKDALRGTIVLLESAALQFGHAGLKATLAGGPELRSLVQDGRLSESGIRFEVTSPVPATAFSVRLISPDGKTVRKWSEYPGPVELGLELRQRLGAPDYSHLPIQNVRATD